MAEKWTKTSSPDWRWMNPKPLLALNHFTVPCSLTDVLPSFLSYLCFSTASSRKAKEAASVNLQPLQSNLKVLQEQQTQPEHSMIWGAGLTLSCVEPQRFRRRIRLLTFVWHSTGISFLHLRRHRRHAVVQIFFRARRALLRDDS